MSKGQVDQTGNQGTQQGTQPKGSQPQKKEEDRQVRFLSPGRVYRVVPSDSVEGK